MIQLIQKTTKQNTNFPRNVMKVNIESPLRINIHEDHYEIKDEYVKLEYRNPVTKVEESVVLRKSTLTFLKAKKLSRCSWPISFVKKEIDDVYILTLNINNNNKVLSVSTSDFFLEKNDLLFQPNI